MDTDFLVVNHGSIFTFLAVSEAAQEFAEEAFADAMTFGGAYVVEHRYAPPIIEDLIERGFTLQ
jgi:hypothetical protein